MKRWFQPSPLGSRIAILAGSGFGYPSSLVGGEDRDGQEKRIPASAGTRLSGGTTTTPTEEDRGRGERRDSCFPGHFEYRDNDRPVNEAMIAIILRPRGSGVLARSRSDTIGVQ